MLLRSNEERESILLDIEGTICPITFVKDVLYPYFLEKLPNYISNLRFPIAEKSGQIVNDICYGFPKEAKSSKEDFQKYIKDLVTQDIKDPVLKSLQGLVWKEGYDKGEITAPLYEDAFRYIERAVRAGKSVYIYSSGSVKAQVMLFEHVQGPDGGSYDIRHLLSGYYDINNAGYKTEPQSYQKILNDIGYAEQAHKVSFFSDNFKEVDAALKTGMEAFVVVKPGNPSINSSDRQRHKVISSFDDTSEQMRNM